MSRSGHVKTGPFPFSARRPVSSEKFGARIASERRCQLGGLEHPPVCPLGMTTEEMSFSRGPYRLMSPPSYLRWLRPQSPLLFPLAVIVPAEADPRKQRGRCCCDEVALSASLFQLRSRADESPLSSASISAASITDALCRPPCCSAPRSSESSVAHLHGQRRKRPNDSVLRDLCIFPISFDCG